MLFSLFKKCGYIVFIVVLSGLFSLTHAASLMIEDDNSAPINLNSYYQLFIDQHHTATIDDILSPIDPPRFKALPNDDDNFGFRSETYWLKLTIDNILPVDQHRFLEFNFPLLDDINVYIVHGLSKRILSHHQLGDFQPFPDRLYQYSNFVIPLTLPAQSSSILYFQIQSTSPMLLGSTLWQAAPLLKQSRVNLFLLSVYAGILLALISYNFLLFLSLRDISYLYYTLFVSAMLLAIGSFNGLWYELLWPNSPAWHKLSSALGFILVGIFSSQFSRSFLQTASNSKLIDKAFSFISTAFLLLFIASLFISMHYISQVLVMLVFILCFTSFIAGIILSLKGSYIARIYLLAWSTLIVGASLLAARNIGWLPDTVLTRYGIIVGSIIDVVLLSFALAYRITLTDKTMDKLHKKIIAKSDKKVITQVTALTSDLKKQNEKLNRQEDVLKKLAFYDSLTGLANRTFVMEQLQHLLAQTRRKKTKLAVLFLDLDNFKPVNDQYGHNVGDRVLTITANRLRSVLRDSDMVGRLSGDEFIVLLESVQGDTLVPEQVADKIKAAVKQPIIMDWFTINISTSIGIARYPNDGANAKDLIAAADSDMYLNKSKKGARNL